MTRSVCLLVLASGAIGLALAGACTVTGGEAPLLTGGGGSSGGGDTSAGGTGGDINITDNPCSGHPSELICDDNVAISCNADQELEAEQDCADEVCLAGTGCVLCIAGTYSCHGNTLRSCNAGPPLKWDDLQTCNYQAGEHCNWTSGACEPLQPIGNGPSGTTGEYYQYAYFHIDSSAFRGGCDVDSYEEKIYVNHGNWYEDGQTLDVYTVQLLDSDGDGVLEPNQHPDNPDNPGAIEERVLTFVTSYTVPSLGMVHHSEIQAADDRVFFLSSTDYTSPTTIFEYVFNNAQTNVVVPSTVALNYAQLGYDDLTGRWYAGYAGNGDRQIYSLLPASNEWVPEFEYPDMTGGHMDGIDVVTDPNTGVAYIYVSDMTSDFLGQYKREGGAWVQANLFEYVGTGDHVEGMGFGALNHFWVTSGGVEQSGALYEIGGGDLTEYTELIPN